jgi:endonuclease/exonuclease/phosphatase (EEP) superfamily protein YafD
MQLYYLSAPLLSSLAIWLISDALFELENSWLLFLHRVLAPLTLPVALFILATKIVRKEKSPSLKARLSLVSSSLIALCCAAPIIRSLVHLTQHTEQAPRSDSEQITLLSFNTLGARDNSKALIAEIERLNPQIIALQELNPELAQAIEQRLASKYQCRILRPSPGSWGMGLLASMPCSERQVSPKSIWVGEPIVIDTTTARGDLLTIANIHAIHPHAGISDRKRERPGYDQLSTWGKLSKTIYERERAIQALLEAIGPTKDRRVLIAGDLNATIRNRVYATIRSHGFNDTWLTLNRSLAGGTWPAPEFLGGLGIGWLLRIDFIFNTQGLAPTSIEITSESLASDHRGMFARFATR